NGNLTISGGKISLPSLKIGSYDLAGIEGSFATDEYGNKKLEAAGTLSLPPVGEVGIEFTLNSQCEYLLQRFCMAAEFAGRGVLIGQTGMLLTEIGGCVIDPDCGNNWLIKLTASVASSDRIVPPDLSLISGDVEMVILTSPVGLEAEGTVYLVGCQLGTAGFGLYADSFHGYGLFEYPPTLNFLRAQTGLDIYWKPFSFLGTADGELFIPASKIPGWGDDINLAGYHAEIDLDGIRGSFYIPNPDNYVLKVKAAFAWSGDIDIDPSFNWNPFSFFDLSNNRRLGVRRYNRSIKLPDAPRMSPITNLTPDEHHGTQVKNQSEKSPKEQGKWMAYLTAADQVNTLQEMGVAYTDTIETGTVPPNASPLIVYVKETPESTGVEVTVTLITPNEVEIDSVYCAGNDGFTYIKSVDHIYYRINVPEEGVWRIVVNNVDAGEDYLFEAAFINEIPNIALLQPGEHLSGTTEEDYEISWAVSDPESNDVLVSLYAIRASFDSPEDSLNPGPWLLADNLPDTVTSFTWQPRDQRDGIYRIIARAEDPYESAVPDTCNFTITLDNADAPGQPTDLLAQVGPGKLRLTWNQPSDMDVEGYRIFWSEQDSARVDTFTIGNTD
ncbi:MAG: hypothetical protein KAJ19_21000, partial [Gammaproteobacteria bacterium]|nr:hypothetical protein [Gammaproteobacteria bacterium]